LNQGKIPEAAAAERSATKGISRILFTSRRRVLALIGGLSIATLAGGARASGPAEDDLLVRDGWILRAGDLARLNIE
jgi:hypothetical protein